MISETVSSGSEVAIHVARVFIGELGDDANLSMLQIDPEKAFNLDSRHAFLVYAVKHLSQLLPWVHFRHGINNQPHL